jgi:hypothetical protein
MTVANFGTATWNDQTLELHHDRDGRWRWYTEDGKDTETSGITPTEACERAQESWPGIEFNFTL